MSEPHTHRLRRRPGWFRPVPLRGRHDGWSEVRQCVFLAQLYVTGSVTAAAKAVGMSRASAYRLRERPGAKSFAFAWDRVLSLPGCGHPGAAREDNRKVTMETLFARLESELAKPVVYRGAMAESHESPRVPRFSDCCGTPSAGPIRLTIPRSGGRTPFAKETPDHRDRGRVVSSSGARP